MITQILPYLQTAVSFCTLIGLLYAFKKFLGTPHATLDARVTKLEIEQNEIKQSLLQGNDRFRNQNTTLEVIQKCLLALIDFELSYCSHTDYNEDISDLQEAKKLLRNHLSSSKS